MLNRGGLISVGDTLEDVEERLRIITMEEGKKKWWIKE